MFNPVLAASESMQTTIALIYRGIAYELPKQRIEQPKRTLEKIATLAGKELIYRGNRYKLVSAASPVEVKQIGKRLIYRGTTYQI